ncbi:uncharacterized protein LOC132708310 [Cylas formicarius]|uniref:uncharacterized protein LOC132708310 n=1 Tax=Cylas formicarius TaxID=197179 RepID=UPI00295873AD|nr:uncharacterized protein LOC132708310 [Cylas formicarius]
MAQCFVDLDWKLIEKQSRAMDVLTTKIVVMVLFGVTRFFFGVLPLRLYKSLRKWRDSNEDFNTFVNQKRHERVSCGVVMCQSFGGGVMFATCFLYFVKKLFITYEELKMWYNYITEYPWSQVGLGVGFFLVYFTEEWIHWILSRRPRATKTNLEYVSSFRPIAEEALLDEGVSPKPSRSRRCKDPSTDSGLETDSVRSQNAAEMLKMTKRERLNSIVSEFSDHKVDHTYFKYREQLARYVVAIIALTIHWIIEGASLGLRMRRIEIWYLFVAATTHSISILFCIGLEMLLAKTRMWYIVLQIALLAMATPLGILVGIIATIESLGETFEMAVISVVSESLSSGAILYITFFEILNREKERRVHRLKRALCIIGGFVAMALLQYVETIAEIRQRVLLTIVDVYYESPSQCAKTINPIEIVGESGCSFPITRITDLTLSRATFRMDLITTKIMVAVLFALTRFVFGVLPTKLQKYFKRVQNDGLDYTTVLCQSIGGGILFATCFLHIMKRLFFCVEDLKRYSGIKSQYPWAQLALGIGFFSVYFLEEWAHWAIEKASEEENSDVYPLEERPKKNAAKIKKRQRLMRWMLTVTAISSHSLLEGLSIGLQKNLAEIWYLFIAVSCHLASFSFCLGLELLLAETKVPFVVLQMALLATINPLGILLGLLVTIETPAKTMTRSIVTTLLEGFSTGTILYVTFFEVLNREKERRVYVLPRSASILGGFVVVAVLEYGETVFKGF